MSRKFIIQLILIVLVIVAFVSYIKPKFDELRQKEDSIVQYKEAVSNATQFTSLLADLSAKADNISAGELQALEKFLPSEIDVVEVEQDIEAMALLSGLIPISIGANAVEEDGSKLQSDEEESEMSPEKALQMDLDSRTFSVVLVGEYDDFKTFLENLEINAYPLHISSLEVMLGDSEGVAIETSGLIFNLILEARSLDLVRN